MWVPYINDTLEVKSAGPTGCLQGRMKKSVSLGNEI